MGFKDNVEILSVVRQFQLILQKKDFIPTYRAMNQSFYYLYVNKVFTSPTILLLETIDENEVMLSYKKLNLFWSGGIVAINNGHIDMLKFYGNPIFQNFMLTDASKRYFTTFDLFLNEDLCYTYLDCLHLWLCDDFVMDDDFVFPGECNTVSDVVFAANLYSRRMKYHDLQSWHLIYDINIAINDPAVFDNLNFHGFDGEMIGEIDGGIYFEERSDFSAGIYAELFFKEAGILPIAGIAALSKQPQHQSKDVECSSVPILLIHGCDFNSRQWIILVNTLRDAGFTHIFTIDLDDTKFTTQGTIDSYSDKVLLILDEIEAETGYRESILVGHSMGGLVSTEVAYEYPDRVRSVVTVSSPLVGSTMVSFAHSIGFPTHDALNQMDYGSEYIRALGKKALHLENTNTVPYYSAYSIVDEMVQPSITVSRHPERTLILSKSGHFSILFSTKFNNWLINVLHESQLSNIDEDSTEETITI